MRCRVRRPWVALFAGALLLGPAPRAFAQPEADDRPRAGSVILAGEMPNPDLMTLSVAAAAFKPDTTFLMDTPKARTSVKLFFDATRPATVQMVGRFPPTVDPIRRWGVGAPVLDPAKASRDPVAFAWSLAPAGVGWCVVVSPDQGEELFRAAALAGAMKVPLFVTRDGDEPMRGFKELAAAKGVRQAYAVGAAAAAVTKVGGVEVVRLADASAVDAAHRRELAKSGPPRLWVMASPGDVDGCGVFAPWVSTLRKAPLILTDEEGMNSEKVFNAALQGPDARTIDQMLVVADPDAIPQAKRRNPTAGKDGDSVDVEPWIPTKKSELITVPSGRIFNPDRAGVPLMLARSKILNETKSQPKVFISSNPGDGLRLLETFSRNTGREMENAGCKVTSMFGRFTLTETQARQAMTENDYFIWEGHNGTVRGRFGVGRFQDPMRPSIAFIQSCAELNAQVAGPLLDRGAVAVIGTPNRMFSGSGGAYVLAFSDALAYDGMTVGQAMRHAMNYMLMYAELKEVRLGGDARLGGANRRAAWTFALWGDPLSKLPTPTPGKDAMPRLQTTATKTSITMKLPESKYPTTEVMPYRAEMYPGGRLAGLYSYEGEDEGRSLVPLAFAEVAIPDAPNGKTPHLSSRVPARNYVYRWDARRKVMYLLLLPRDKDVDAVEFRVHWDAPAGHE
ncbi:MAG: C25 family cysteine peptidase [Gemmataceae bacterium]